MDDVVKRAEELLAQRMGKRTNGHPLPEATTVDEEVGKSARSAVEEPAEAALTRDLQRLAADFANYRKRNEAERIEFARYAKGDLIAKLLEVLDGYDRALGTVPDDAKGQPWVEGMWLVERKLRSLLESEGLQTVDSIGMTFDPYVHEAVAQISSDEPEGTVIREHQKAYRLHDRVIRPALVTVSKGRGDGTPAAETKEE